MIFNALRYAVADGIRAKMPALADVATHAGRFDLAELKRIATKTPCVRVAVLGAPEVESIGSGEREVRLRMAAYIVTTDRRGLARDDSALAIVCALCDLVPDNTWSTRGAHPAQRVSADNLFSGTLDRGAVALWAVSWEQTVRIGEDMWIEDGVLPTDVYANDEEVAA